MSDDDGVVLPENGRFSFRLNAKELERVRGLMEYFAKKYPKGTKITQKFIFLEGLEGIDYHLAENARKSRVTKTRATRRGKGKAGPQEP